MNDRKKMAVRDRVAAYRARLREEGLRPVQIWIPDTRSEEFRAEARRQAAAIARSPHEPSDQAFIDAISEPEDG